MGLKNLFPAGRSLSCYNTTSMIHHVRAIYEHGVLRPVDPLPLPERHEVHLVVSDEPLPQVRIVPAEEYSRYADDNVTIEQVRQSVSKIPGSLAEDFIVERNERS